MIYARQSLCVHDFCRSQIAEESGKNAVGMYTNLTIPTAEKN